MNTPTLSRPTPVPPKPVNAYRKHVGYHCLKCGMDKILQFSKLCDCLIFEEDPKVIKRHINSEWVPLYAERPPHAPYGGAPASSGSL